LVHLAPQATPTTASTVQGSLSSQSACARQAQAGGQHAGQTPAPGKSNDHATHSLSEAILAMVEGFSHFNQPKFGCFYYEIPAADSKVRGRSR
jgi:hypothetical protein